MQNQKNNEMYKLIEDNIEYIKTNKGMSDIVNCILNNGDLSSIYIKLPIQTIETCAINLRNFHNVVVKDSLYTEVFSNKFFSQVQPKRLLEIAVGRGGDLNRWVKLCENLNLEYVFGLDISEESLKEAQNRYSELLRRKKILKFKFESIQRDLLENQEKLNNKFNYISIQFAINYFAKYDDLDKLLSFVSEHLIKGGIFFGTAVDGDKLLNIFQKNGNIINTNLLKLELNEEAQLSYSFNIKTQNRNVYDQRRGSAGKGGGRGRASGGKGGGRSQIRPIIYSQMQKEYEQLNNEFILKKDKLIETARNYDLELIEIESFYDIYKKNYCQSNIKMTFDEMLISFLYFSFKFQKINN